MGDALCPSDLPGPLVTGRGGHGAVGGRGGGRTVWAVIFLGLRGRPASQQAPPLLRRKQKEARIWVFVPVRPAQGPFPGRAGRGRVRCLGALFSLIAGSLLQHTGSRQFQKEELGGQGHPNRSPRGSLLITGDHSRISSSVFLEFPLSQNFPKFLFNSPS